MILGKSKHPAIRTSVAWTIATSNTLGTFDYKIRGKIYTFEIRGMSQRDKMIYEFCLKQAQLKKTDKIILDYYVLFADMKIKNNYKNKKMVRDTLDRINTLILEVKDPNTKSEIVYDLRDTIQHKKIKIGQRFKYRTCIDFTILMRDSKPKEVQKDNGPNQRPQTIIMKKSKKYLFNTKSEDLLWALDFFRMKVQQRNKISTQHPYSFRYRSFRQEDILRWFNLLEEYKLAKDQHDYKAVEIERKIARVLHSLKSYSEKNKYSFPSYRLKDGMYQVTDYNYPIQENKIDQIREMLSP